MYIVSGRTRHVFKVRNELHLSARRFHVSVRRLMSQRVDVSCFIVTCQTISLPKRSSLSLYNVLEPEGVVDRDDHRYIRIRKARRKRGGTNKGEVARVRRHTVMVVRLIGQGRAGLHPEPLPGLPLLCAPGHGAPRYDVADIHDHRLRHALLQPRAELGTGVGQCSK